MSSVPAGGIAESPAAWTSLLQPIPGADPCGESLRYEGTYDRVRRARQSDDETLAQGVWETAARKADWAAVATICAPALADRSKDLQLAGWLLEAWIHLHGFAGAEAGLALIHGLCVRFWSGLHPRQEDGGREFRYSAIAWINDKLATELKLVPITAPQSSDVEVYSFADWEKAQHLAQAGLRTRQPEEGTAARAAFQKSLSQTPARWLGQRRREVQAIAVRIRDIESALDESVAPGCPGLIGLRRVAEAIDRFLGGVLLRREPEAGPRTERRAAAQMELPDIAMGPDHETGIGGDADATAAETISIQSREQAYRLLAAVAAYLLATEPHSPVPYLVQRAVAWGGMRLADLLPELIRDRENLTEIHRLLRIGPAMPAGPSSS